MRFFGLIMLAGIIATSAHAQAPRESDWVAKNFRFHTGDVLSELKLHYTTVGNPDGEPVLVLHGTGGSGSGMLNPAFGGELFGQGQPLDARKYFIILPDAIGAGKSAKPSDGLRMKFPRYNYDDLVAAQYRLLTEGLGIHHLRLVIGNSMGGMMAWTWGEAYAGFMDALVPMASQPTAMASRNWMMRRMMIETIKADPTWKNGDYTVQPPALKYANAMFAIATSGGTLGWQERALTRAAADRIVDEQLAAPSSGDANDTIYQFDASRDYDAAPNLDRIEAWVLAINSADDERNPVETGIMPRQIARLKHGKLYVIPASSKTRGHGTTGNAGWWKSELGAWLPAVPVRN
ncbi:MAG TPA: alpha/beta fold hydrolase [Rhizomicrobium sp.]|jgi:homoserine O-acetyltransferase